eukprot:1154771-Pelagomonas_calceolata.AAC.1
MDTKTKSGRTVYKAFRGNTYYARSCLGEHTSGDKKNFFLGFAVTVRPCGPHVVDDKRKSVSSMPDDET